MIWLITEPSFVFWLLRHAQRSRTVIASASRRGDSAGVPVDWVRALHGLAREAGCVPGFVPSGVGVAAEAPGPTPGQVEAPVTRAIENWINGLGNLEALRSESI